MSAEAVFRIFQERPDILDLLKESRINWIITTAKWIYEAMSGEMLMKSGAIAAGFPVTTTFAGAVAAVQGICKKRGFGRFEALLSKNTREKESEQWK